MADAHHRAARHHQGPRRVRRPPGGLGPRRSRREVAPRRRGRRALRPGAAVRVDHRRRHRRLHHRRRARADGPHLRARHRQGARHRGRHRRRRAAAGDPDRAPRALLRPARRRRGCSASSPRSSSTWSTSRGSTAARCGSTATDAATVIERWRALVRRPARARHHVLRAVPAARRCRACRRMLAGRLTLSVRYVWTGDADEGERRFAAIREAAPVILDDVAHKPYTAIDSVHTDPLDPTPAYEAAAVLTDFPAEAVDALLALTGPGVGVAAGPGRGAPDGRGVRPRRASTRAPSPRATRRTRCSSSASPRSPAWRTTRPRSSRRWRPWTGGHRLPNFTFTPEEYVDAYDEVTLARLRRARPHLRPRRRAWRSAACWGERRPSAGMVVHAR